jgi:hypothetical protein
VGEYGLRCKREVRIFLFLLALHLCCSR